MTMSHEPKPPVHSWASKFRYAFRGLTIGILQQNSFLVHIPIAAAVLGAAAWFRVSGAEWCVLLLCIMVVSSAEMFNSSLEHLAKAVTCEQREEIRDSLDTAAAAVLVASIGSVLVGVIIFGPRLLALLRVG